MTFLRKHSGDSTRPIIAVYTCPEHGEFDAEVARDENGEAPDVIPCEFGLGATIRQGQSESGWVAHIALCSEPATWTPSPTVGCRVRRVEVSRGKYEKPERKTYLDTRELGEGQSVEEFQAKRRKIWREKREAEAMAIRKGF